MLSVSLKISFPSFLYLSTIALNISVAVCNNIITLYSFVSIITTTTTTTTTPSVITDINNDIVDVVVVVVVVIIIIIIIIIVVVVVTIIVIVDGADVFVTVWQ